MKRIVACLVLSIVITAAPAQTQSKSDNIKTLLDLTGSGKMGVQVAETMLGSFRKTYPQIPADFWDQFLKELKSDALIQMIIPVYDKHFSENEVEQLIAFYQTPLGQKVVSVMPQVMQESMSAGRIWGEAMAEKIFDEMKEKGLLDK